MGSTGDVGPSAGPVDPAARPRRTSKVEYRARVVAEYAAAPREEKVGVLQREGMYESQIREWTVAQDNPARGVWRDGIRIIVRENRPGRR